MAKVRNVVRSLRYALSIASAALSACGGGAPATATSAAQVQLSDVAGALRTTAPPFALPSPTPFYRLDLTRASDGALSVARSAGVVLTREALPALNPEYMLVAYAGASVVSALPLAFPASVLGYGLVAGVPTHDRQPLSTGQTSVFLPADPSIDRIAILTIDGTSVLDLAAADLPALRTDKAREPLQLSPYGRARQPLRDGELQAAYDHIDFLDSTQNPLLAKDALAGGSIVDRTEEMNDVISDGLAALSPALLSSVQTVAVVRWLSGTIQDKLLGFSLGPTMLLNVRNMQDPEMVPTIVHEAAHNLEDLTDAAASASGQLVSIEEWPAEVARSARALVDRFGLSQGLVATWRALHTSGRSTNATADYIRDTPLPATAPRDLTEDVARQGGFATPAGAVSSWEDLAEYVGTVQSPSDIVPGICPIFSGGGDLTPAVAIPYAKLTLLLGVGALSEAAFENCAQGTRLPEERGIHFGGSAAFEEGLKAGSLPADVGKSYGILGTGPNSYQLLVKVWVPDTDASPLGLRRVREVFSAGADGSALSGAFLSNDEPLKVRVSQSGLMLLTDARPERTAGAIFGLVLKNAAGLPTDNWALGTFRIP